MTTLDRLQEDNKRCGCSACVHERFVMSTRKALLPSPERVQQARAALVQALSLLDELTDEEPCDCPKCSPERWNAGPLGTWIKDGDERNHVEPFACKIS